MKDLVHQFPDYMLGVALGVRSSVISLMMNVIFVMRKNLDNCDIQTKYSLV